MTTTVDTAAITGMDLSAYFVSDPARAIAFYRDVLGLEPTEVDDQGRGAEFTLADGQTFGVWNSGDGGPTSGGVLMFAVADAKAAVERIRANGGTIPDPEETPACYMAHAQDPDGNAFIIHQKK